MYKFFVSVSTVAAVCCCIMYADNGWGKNERDILSSPRYRIPLELSLKERSEQIVAIEKVFARRTKLSRARELARLCNEATLNSPFSPLDMAEIALAETGGHRLSARAVSERGALGVWQLMPGRARSHGYQPQEMLNDATCAEAAVKELSVKLEMARGNLLQAKQLYCGVGPDAEAYTLKRTIYRRELLLALPLQQQNETPGIDRVAYSLQ